MLFDMPDITIYIIFIYYADAAFDISFTAADARIY